MAETSPQQSAYYDTGRDVSGPHHPQPIGQDEEMHQFLISQHDLAQARLNAHRDELLEQTEHHEIEMARARRVIEACEAAMREIAPPDKAVPAPTPTETRAMRGAPGFA